MLRIEAMLTYPEAIACPRPRRQSDVIKAPPPPSHSTLTQAKISDFQEKRLKSMTASLYRPKSDTAEFGQLL